MARNLENAGGKVKGGVLAEPAYILLGEAGINDGHEVIRKITLEAEKSGKTFFEVLKTHKEAFEKITAQLEKLGVENPENFFEHPANYCDLLQKIPQACKEIRKADGLILAYAKIHGGFGWLGQNRLQSWT